MSRKATGVALTREDEQTLRQWIRASTTEQRLALRARIVLAAAQGETTTGIACREKVRLATISKWRQRFAKRGFAGLQDAPRPGPPRHYTEVTKQRVLKQLDQPRRLATAGGMGACWPRLWATSRPGRCGEF
jgi:transposase